MAANDEFMREAIRLADENVDKGGGPFGAVIVRKGEIVGTGVNRVTANNDPTAHAEVTAIRNAAAALGTFDLSDCEVYTSCEPCPMCLGAIYWAHLKTIYYGNTQADAADIDFDDSFIYKQLALPMEKRSIRQIQLLHAESLPTFKKWKEKTDKTQY